MLALQHNCVLIDIEIESEFELEHVSVAKGDLIADRSYGNVFELEHVSVARIHFIRFV